MKKLIPILLIGLTLGVYAQNSKFSNYSYSSNIADENIQNRDNIAIINHTKYGLFHKIDFYISESNGIKYNFSIDIKGDSLFITVNRNTKDITWGSAQYLNVLKFESDKPINKYFVDEKEVFFVISPLIIVKNKQVSAEKLFGTWKCLEKCKLPEMKLGKYDYMTCFYNMGCGHFIEKGDRITLFCKGNHSGWRETYKIIKLENKELHLRRHFKKYIYKKEELQ